MRKAVGFLLILAGVVAGFYVGIWWFVIPGIEDVVNGAKADPTNGWQIVWGILQVTPLAEIVGFLVFLLLAVPGGALMGRKRSFLPRRRSQLRSRRR